MDAVSLIEDTRHALARSTEAPDIVTEAWQAQALAEAVGGHLVMAGPPEVRAQASGLCEASGRACGSLRGPGQRTEKARAARLTEIRDPLSALRRLGGLLDESGGALVRVAVEAEEEGLYWRCIEGIDAADECGDRVTEILRRLALRVPPPGEHADRTDRWDADPWDGERKERGEAGGGEAESPGTDGHGAERRGTVREVTGRAGTADRR